MKNTIIFDLDGTLLNTLTDLALSTNYALTAHSLPTRTTDEIRLFLGSGMRTLIERAVPAATPSAQIDAVYQTFTAHYALHDQDHTAPYPDILPLLTRLTRSHLQLAVVSNKNDDAVKSLIPHYFGDLIPLAIGATPTRAKKPAPDGILAAMSLLHADPAHTLFVGDSEIDYQAGRNAGLDCVLVSWGFRDKSALETLHPYAIIDHPTELLSYLD